MAGGKYHKPPVGLLRIVLASQSHALGALQESDQRLHSQRSLLWFLKYATTRGDLGAPVTKELPHSSFTSLLLEASADQSLFLGGKRRVARREGCITS